jgi:hypothetical protein
MPELNGYFRRTYGPLKGSDWLRHLPECERAAFAHIGLAAGGYGRQGGKARAQNAQRDARGRFASNEVKS